MCEGLVGGGGHLFSLKTLFFFLTVFRVSQSRVMALSRLYISSPCIPQFVYFHAWKQ